jgi:hypothetical protein
MRMTSTLPVQSPPQALRIDVGTVRQASWDKRAWTLLVEMRASGQRLVQIPAYQQEPHPGDRIELIGRQPLMGVRINDIDVFEKRPAAPLPGRAEIAAT